MKNGFTKKILVAIDGSEHALEAVRYASDAMNWKTTKVVLFHVLRKIDEAFWSIGIKKAVSERMIDLKAWESAQDKAVKKIITEARQIFIDKGYGEVNVNVNVRKCEQGVAKDIIRESQKGYDAIFLGRQGVSKIKDLVVGGTAQKLIEKTTHIPICVVDKGATSEKLIIALDASEGAGKAVDYVGTMLGDTETEVLLLHMLSDISGFDPGFGFAYTGPITTVSEKVLEEEKKEMTQVFAEAKKRLTSAGFDGSRVSVKMITDIGHPANTLMNEARESKYGTIVVGRRGISKTEEFFMGSMSNKVVHLGKRMAVWVVS